MIMTAEKEPTQTRTSRLPNDLTSLSRLVEFFSYKSLSVTESQNEITHFRIFTPKTELFHARREKGDEC